MAANRLPKMAVGDAVFVVGFDLRDPHLLETASAVAK